MKNRTRLQDHPTVAMWIGLTIATVYLLWANGLAILPSLVDSPVWLICLVIYVLCLGLAGPLSQGVWAGHLFMIAMLIWLIDGLVPALWLVIIGSLLTAGFAIFQHRQHILSHFIHASQRISIGSIPLVISNTLLYIWESPPIRPLENIPLIIGILIVAFAVTQLMGMWHISPESRTRLFSQPYLRSRFITEIILSAIIIPLAVVYEQNGALILGTLMALIAIQAIRQWQFTRVQMTLERQLNELSHANDITKRIANSLLLEDLFGYLHHWSTQLNLSAFFIAQQTDDTLMVKFPFVVQNATRIDNMPAMSDALPFVQRVKRDYKTLETSLSDNGLHVFPLYVEGTKIGLLGMVEDAQSPIYDQLSPDTLRMIASHIALRLHNTGLYEHSVHLAQSLQHINDGVKKVLFNVDKASTLEATCQMATYITNASQAAIFLVDNHGMPYYTAGYGLTEKHIQQYKIGEMPPSMSQSSLFYPDLNTETASLYRFLLDHDIQAMAQIPLHSSDSVIGVLQVFHHEPHSYNDIERELLETIVYQLVAAIDNLYLVTALENYATEQSELLHLSRVLTSTLDLDETIQHVTALLQQILGVTWVGIGLLPKSVNYFQFYRSNDQSRHAVLLDDLPEVYTVYQTKSPSLLSLQADTATVSEQTHDWMTFHNIRTLGVMLMTVENNIVGALFLGQAEPHHFTVSQERVLEVARNQIASQIHNALQYQDTQDALNLRLKELGLIEGISQKMSSALNMHTLTQGLLEGALRATNADMVSFSLLNTSDDLEVVLAQVEPTGTLTFRTLEFMPILGAVKEVFKNGKILIIPDNQDYPDYRDVFGRVYRSSLVVPLMHQGQVIGVINAESDQLDYFKAEQAVFLTSLAGHAAVSIQNTRLLQDRQAQIETLDNLRELSVRLSVELDESIALSRILETALNVLDGDAALLVQLDVQTHTFIQRLEIGDEHYIPHLKAHLDDILDAAILQRQVQIQAYDHDDMRTLIVIPIEADEVVSGLCLLLRRAQRDHDLNTANLIGIQADAHLRNLTLHQRIRAQNSRMHAILASTRDGVLMFDHTGTMIDANTSASDLLGIQFDEYIGKNLRTDLLRAFSKERDEDEDATPLEIVLQEADEHLQTQLMTVTSGALEVRLNNRTHYLHHVSTPVLSVNGTFMGRLLTFRDVTDEQQLAAYRDEIASMVVHDLRSPLGSMITGLNLMRELAQSQNDYDSLEVIALVLSSGMRMLDLINSILDVSRLERGNMPIRRTWITLPMILDDALGALVGLRQEASLIIEQAIPDDLPPVYVDVDKIRRVMINLLDNAMRYTPTNGQVLIRATLREDKKVLIQVADEGPGIGDEHVKHIFEKFSQGDQTHAPRRGEKGSGLGLAYCKLALEAHGESIWVEHESPLSGACLAFTLPTEPSVNDLSGGLG